MSIRKHREQDLTGPVIAFLALADIYAFRLNAGKVQTAHGTWVQLAPKGTADVVGVLPGGRWLCVELKRKGGKVRKEQAEWLDMMRGKGALCVVITSVEDLRTALRLEGYRTP